MGADGRAVRNRTPTCSDPRFGDGRAPVPRKRPGRPTRKGTGGRTGNGSEGVTDPCGRLTHNEGAAPCVGDDGGTGSETVWWQQAGRAPHRRQAGRRGEVGYGKPTIMGTGPASPAALPFSELHFPNQGRGRGHRCRGLQQTQPAWAVLDRPVVGATVDLSYAVIPTRGRPRDVRSADWARALQVRVGHQVRHHGGERRSLGHIKRRRG